MNNIYSILKKFLKYILLVTKIKNNKIVVCNFGGKGYGDNPKYIIEELVAQNLKLDIVWLVEDIKKYQNEFPKNIKLIKYGSLRGLYELATAKLWIDNARKYFYTPKRKNQYYIQTWHGCIPLKRIEKDAESTLDSNYLEYAKNDSKMADLFISNSKFCTSLYEKSFWYSGEVLECGSPRNDILIKHSDKYSRYIKDYYNLSIDTKIAIYAPTFRKSNTLDAYKLDYNKCISALEKKFGGKWIILVRLHPNISRLASSISYSSNAINASEYEDMQHLLAAGDILITDYSSSMFDFGYTKKPVFLFAEDIEEYKNDRNFYFDIECLPFKLAKSNEELEKNISNFDDDKYKYDLEKFMSKLEICENGRASYSVVEVIKKVINYTN